MYGIIMIILIISLACVEGQAAWDDKNYKNRHMNTRTR